MGIGFIRPANWQKALAAAVFAAIMTAVLALPPLEGLFSGMEDRSLDYRMLLRGSVRAHAPIVIVLIDDKSALHYGFRSPVPRALLADVVSAVARKGARVIGLDVLLDASFDYRGGPLDRFLSDTDLRLGSVLARHADKIVAAAVPIFMVRKSSERDVGPAMVQNPFPMLAHLGHSRAITGAGEIARWLDLGSDDLRASFVVEVLRLFDERAAAQIVQAWPAGEHLIRLNYPGPPSRLESSSPIFPVISAADALQAPAALFSGQIVLIGSGDDDLGDTYITPFSASASRDAKMFGVELHAIAINTLLTNSALLEPPRPPLVAVQFLAMFATGLCVMFFGLVPAVLVALAIFLAWTGGSFWLYADRGILVPVVVPGIGMLASWLAGAGLRLMTEIRYGAYLRKNFKKYVPPDLVDRLVANPHTLDLGGEPHEVSVLFSDLQGFTTLSEKLPPHELIGILNEYLGRMTDLVFKESGTLDKYEGDAVMAVFGVPLDDAEHAHHACRTALHMQQALGELNRGWEARGLEKLRARIGVNSGKVIAGNIGSKLHMDYTVIGDAVNLASRLEGLNKFFGTSVLISQATLKCLPAGFETRELGKIMVKGKKTSTTVYQLITEADRQALRGCESLRARYAAGLAEFYVGRFNEAASIFAELEKTHNDSAAAFMLTQTRFLQANPPAPGWSGAIEMHAK